MTNVGSLDSLKRLHFHYHKTYDKQTWQGANLWEEVKYANARCYAPSCRYFLKDWHKVFFYKLIFVSHSVRDQDRTSFLKHAGKYFVAMFVVTQDACEPRYTYDFKNHLDSRK